MNNFKGKKIAMLGSGFIARFYADAILDGRSPDHIISVYSRSKQNANKFARDYDVPIATTDLKEAMNADEVDIVCVALPNHMHEKSVMKCVEAGKPVLVTKPLGRNAEEALRMLKAVEEANLFNGYLEDLVYTPKTLKSLDSVRKGAIGRVLWAKSRETHPGPHSDWFWDMEKAGGGAIIDLGCHCIEIGRSYIGKDIKPLEVMCWADTQVKPIEAEDHAIGLIRYENGAIGQFEASWTFRGGMDLRDEIMGTEGTIWINNFLRTGFEMFTTGDTGEDYLAEKSESDSGWLFPMADELNDLGYLNMFQDMFNSLEEGVEPIETFYDGYIVNAIIDSAYKSAKTKKWEKIDLPIWRGKKNVEKENILKSYDDNFYLIKKETTHYGAIKLILKNKETDEIVERVVKN